MPIEQVIITWAHLVSAAIWVGGSLFIGVVLAPILKTMSFSLEERLQMMIKVGRRFNKIAIPSLIILIGSGLYQSHQILLSIDYLSTSSYGIYLVIKIIMVIALIITYVVHVRIIRKDVEEQIISNQIPKIQIQKLRTRIIVLGQITVVLSIAILFMASLLDSGA